MIPTTERFPSSSVSLYRTRLSNVYISLSFPFRLPAPRTISAHPPSAVSSYIALTFCHETHYIRFEPRCLLTGPEYCRICRTHGAVSATAAAQTKKIIKKAKKVVDESVSLQYNTNRSIHWLSPNGKATDSDSVIFKVRILVAQLKSICLPKTA